MMASPLFEPRRMFFSDVIASQRLFGGASAVMLLNKSFPMSYEAIS